MRVLGVDPGLTRCGFGVIEGAPGRALSLVATGVVGTSADEEIGLRLLALEEHVERWLTDYRPDAVAVTPGGLTAYVVDGANKLVYPITIASGARGTGITARPNGLAWMVVRRPCRGCARIRAAGCFSSNPMTGCAARVIGRRSHRPARSCLTPCRQHWHRCRA